VKQPPTTNAIPCANLPLPSHAPAFHPRERFFRVSYFLARLIWHISFWDIFLGQFRLTRWYVRRTAKQRWAKLARRFRYLALQLGGIQIKLGQFLSARADIIPEEVRQELAGLQDEVPPAPGSHALERIIEELGAPPSELFLQFEAEPVAAASLGQVHFATLHDGREVAVKVQRPHIEEIIEVDLRALAWAVKIIKRYEPIRRRVNLEELLKEFSRVLHQEVDYVQEAQNAAVFRQNFAEVAEVYIPEPILNLTTRRVLVMERISGVKINDFKVLDAAGVNRHELAQRLNQAYLKQFFFDGIFHADPHPGNLFVHLEPPKYASTSTNGKGDSSLNAAIFNNQNLPTGTPFTLIFVDFGMVGHLTPETMGHLRSGIIGLATKDAERIVEALQKANVLLPSADKRVVSRGIQVLMQFVYERKTKEMDKIAIEAILSQAEDFVYDLPFQLPQDLLYLGRAISMVSGMATAIDPEINLFQELKPFANQMIAQESKNGTSSSLDELREFGQILLRLPRQMDSFYKTANRGELLTKVDLRRLERMVRRVERSTERLTGGLVATGLFLGGVELRTKGLEKEARQAWGAAIVAFLWALWPRGERS